VWGVQRLDEADFVQVGIVEQRGRCLQRGRGYLQLAKQVQPFVGRSVSVSATKPYTVSIWPARRSSVEYKSLAHVG
jgi:hypothetical protein